MNTIMSKEQAQRIKAAYRPGMRIVLISTEDAYTKLKPGDQGTLLWVDGAGQLVMAWDNGSRLSLIPGVDSFRLA